MVNTHTHTHIYTHTRARARSAFLHILSIIKHLPALLRGLDKAQLLQRCKTAFLPNLLNDLPVLHGEDRHAGEPHLLARVRLGQGANREIIKRSASVRAAADPATEDVVALGDERVGTVSLEAEVGECLLVAV